MIEIQEIFDRLNGIEASIAQHSRQVGADLSTADRLVLTSLAKRRDELREMLGAASAERLVDLCEYKILPNEAGRYPVRGVSGALEGWQSMVTSFFGAIRDKPRDRAPFPREIVAASTLNVGYTFPGSLGFVLYVPNDQFLPTKTDLELAVQGIVDLSRAEDVETVRRLKDQFGKTSIVSFYRWSETHLGCDFDADIKWGRGQTRPIERVVQRSELEKVRQLIDAADEAVEKTVSLRGVLSSKNIPRRSFAFVVTDTDQLITGTLDSTFDESIEHSVPGEYEAILDQVVVHRLYAEEDKVTWKLKELREPR